MDFDAKYNMEKYPSQIPPFLHENYSSKPRDDFSLEGSFSSKGTNNFLQDFHPLENFNLNGASLPSNNPMFSLQPTCFYTLDNSTSSCVPIFDLYDTKPYENNVGNNGTILPLINNFSQSGGMGLGSSHMMVTPLNMVSPIGQNHNNPFSFPDFNFLKSRKTPDEGSSSSPKTDVNMPPTMVKKGGRGHKKKITNIIKGQWTIEEDRRLMQLVERHGTRKWSQIAQMLNGRIGKQCRERWHNHLRPDIKKDIWSEEEDGILIKAHEKLGNKWADIAKLLPGRTENSIKNHWNATKRRQLSKRKCRPKYPRQSSLLQDYIKNLAPEIINAGCRKKPPSSTNVNPNPNPNPTNENNNNNNNNNAADKSPNDQNGSSHSSSSYRLGPIFDFSEEVPDFNFDDRMFEESSIDSLLDCVPIEESGFETTCFDDDDQLEGDNELDLADMINQVNL